MQNTLIGKRRPSAVLGKGAVEALATTVVVHTPSEVGQCDVEAKLTAKCVNCDVYQRSAGIGPPAGRLQRLANVKAHVVVNLFRKVVTAAPKVVGTYGIVERS